MQADCFGPETSDHLGFDDGLFFDHGEDYDDDNKDHFGQQQYQPRVLNTLIRCIFMGILRQSSVLPIGHLDIKF